MIEATMIAPTLNPIQPPAEAEAKRRAAREAARKALDVWASWVQARQAVTHNTPTFQAIFSETSRTFRVWTRKAKRSGKVITYVGVTPPEGNGWDLVDSFTVSWAAATTRVESPVAMVAMSVETVLEQAGLGPFGRSVLIGLYPRTGAYSHHEEEVICYQLRRAVQIAENRAIKAICAAGLGVWG